ncbi:hypothetical protein GBA52_011891 [Prunus armeniaca]|nr:hypothetical protein GBA52_011891 [Prunus armeniaca]
MQRRGSTPGWLGPESLKEFIYGVTVGFLWKMYHWNLQRRTKEFYELLGRGEISTVVEDD